MALDELERCAALAAAAAARACSAVRKSLATIDTASTRARSRAAALSALRAHLAHKPLQVAASALLDAATGDAASADDAAVIDAAVAAIRTHAAVAGGEIFTHACALLHRVALAAPESAAHARQVRAFDVMLDALGRVNGDDGPPLQFIVFMPYRGNEKTDAFVASSRAISLALVTLDASRGLDGVARGARREPRACDARARQPAT